MRFGWIEHQQRALARIVGLAAALETRAASLRLPPLRRLPVRSRRIIVRGQIRVQEASPDIASACQYRVCFLASTRAICGSRSFAFNIEK